MKKSLIPILLVSLLLAASACNLPTAASQNTSAPPAPESADEEADRTLTPTEDQTTEAAEPTATPRPSPTPLPPPVTFQDIADGDTLTAEIDPESGLPFVSFTVIPRIDNRRYRPYVRLDADGLHVFSMEILYQESGQERTVRWTPWHGNGTYELDLWMFRSTGRTLDKHSITVQVEGISSEVLTIKERFIQIYQNQLGITLTDPPFIYFGGGDDPALPDTNRWTSVVYGEENYYVIQLVENGKVITYHTTLSTRDNHMGTCRPAGNYRVLTLIVDYKNSDFNYEDVAAKVETAVAETNEDWAQYAKNFGLDEPILQLVNTTTLVTPPPRPGHLLSEAEIRTLTDYDPLDFDVIAQINLDLTRSTLLNLHPGANGLAFFNQCGVGGPRADVNMTVGVSLGGDLIIDQLFQHEFIHLTGWAHEWQIGDGGSESISQLGKKSYPYLLFGWQDFDGDGVIAVYDDTPYGITP